MGVKRLCHVFIGQAIVQHLQPVGMVLSGQDRLIELTTSQMLESEVTGALLHSANEVRQDCWVTGCSACRQMYTGICGSGQWMEH